MSGVRGRHPNERIEQAHPILFRHAAGNMDGVLHDVTALAAVVARWRSIHEINPIPSLERRLVGKMSKPDRKETFERAVGRHPGAADRFPMGGATLR